MLKSIIIDDEVNSRKTLDKLIKNFCPDVEVIALADSIKHGMAEIKKNNPDLIFLDIEMPGGSGFDLLENISPVNFEVIFTTAYDHYAVQAFKFSALDYLLKPIDVKELIAAIEKVKKKKDSQSTNKNLENFLKNLPNFQNNNKIALPTHEGLIFVPINQLIRCESDGNYTHFYLTTGEKIMVSRTMKDFEDILLQNNFFRVHNTHLINMGQIKKYVKGEGGHIVMSDNSQIEVSRRKKEEFLQKLSEL